MIMRLSDCRTTTYVRAAAAVLLLVSAQPVLGQCEAENWHNTKNISVHTTDYADHVQKDAEFRLKKRWWACGLKMKRGKNLNTALSNLRFDCKWEGERRRYATQDDVGLPDELKAVVKTPAIPPWYEKFYHCVSTRAVRLHKDDDGTWSKHDVILVPYFTDDRGGKRKRQVAISLSEDGVQHAGVAPGTGDD
jgi:hypothetical protein